MKTATVVLPPEPHSVRTARTFVAEVLSTSSFRHQRDDAALLVSELVSNAILHATTPIELNVQVDRSHLLVKVRDESPHLPEKLSGGGDTTAGRGLYIIEEVANQWGAERLPGGGKIVWFEFRAT